MGEASERQERERTLVCVFQSWHLKKKNYLSIPPYFLLMLSHFPDDADRLCFQFTLLAVDGRETEFCFAPSINPRTQLSKHPLCKPHGYTGNMHKYKQAPSHLTTEKVRRKASRP